MNCLFTSQKIELFINFIIYLTYSKVQKMLLTDLYMDILNIIYGNLDFNSKKKFSLTCKLIRNIMYKNSDNYTIDYEKCIKNISVDNFGKSWRKLNSHNKNKFYKMFMSHPLISNNKHFKNVASIENLINSDNLKSIIFNDDFNQKIDNLPQRLTHLTFYNNSKFNQEVNNLPQSLTYLKLCGFFNQKVDNLPQSLTHLELGWNFNQKIDNLPQSLTHLVFSSTSKFNQKVDNLPASLIHLELEYWFNQKVDNLPISLIYLKLGDKFNKKIDNLPASLIHITLEGKHFNQKVDKLPQSLTHLAIGRKFNQEVDKLPKNLVELKISEKYPYKSELELLFKNVVYYY